MWIGFNSKSHLKIIYVGKLNETRSKHICVKNNSQKNISVLYQLLMISDFSLIAKRIYSSSFLIKTTLTGKNEKDYIQRAWI